jgi:hypothetical protein
MEENTTRAGHVRQLLNDFASGRKYLTSTLRQTVTSDRGGSAGMGSSLASLHASITQRHENYPFTNVEILHYTFGILSQAQDNISILIESSCPSTRFRTDGLSSLTHRGSSRGDHSGEPTKSIRSQCASFHLVTQVDPTSLRALGTSPGNRQKRGEDANVLLPARVVRVL